MLALLAATLVVAPGVQAQSTVSIESNQQLFAVMCALHAAGYEMDAAAVGAHPVRLQLRSELARLDGPATQALRQFYREHQAGDAATTLSRYISFAMVVGAPPRFDFTLRREDLPPDVLLLEGFNEVLAAFYREAQIESLWTRVQPAYQREIRGLEEPVGQIVFTATGYLREVHRPKMGRMFAVYVEPLVGGKINFRSYGDRYTVVLSPGSDPPIDDIRHAYLHFLIDPLAFRYPGVVESRRALHRFVGRAARIAPEFRDDFPALLTECLVRAVELRLKRLPAARLAAALDEADADGYILVRAFWRGLDEFDKSEPAMNYFFPDLVRAIDLKAEAARLEKVQFAAALPAAPPSERPQISELELWLREGEQQIVIPEAAAAVATFERMQAKYPGQPRALYGLAVAKLLLREVEAAKGVLQQIVTGTGLAPGLAPDPRILAMAHVHLGRIYDIEGSRELAISEYRAALTVEGAPEMALQAARRGMEKKFEPVRSNKEPEPQRP